MDVYIKIQVVFFFLFFFWLIHHTQAHFRVFFVHAKLETFHREGLIADSLLNPTKNINVAGTPS